MYIVFQIDKKDQESLNIFEDLANIYPSIKIKEIEHFGYKEFVDIFIPVVLTLLPIFLSKIDDMKKVKIIMDGNTFHNTPKEFIKKMIKYSKMDEMIQLYSEGKVKVDGQPEDMYELDKLIEEYMKNEEFIENLKKNE